MIASGEGTRVSRHETALAPARDGEGSARARTGSGAPLPLPLRRLAHPEDVLGLGDDVRRRVLAALCQLKREPLLGSLVAPPREWHRFRVNFSEHGLRSLHVQATLELEARILYRIIEGSIEVVAIGPRARSAVYQLAASRLAGTAKPRRLRFDRGRAAA